MLFLEAAEIARRAVEAAWDKQASDIVMLDTRAVCSFADYFIICSGETQRQMEAIRDEVDKALTQGGARLLHQEGEVDSGWMLLDFGAIIVHIFSPDQREYYGLDRLWSHAPAVLRAQ